VQIDDTGIHVHEEGPAPAASKADEPEREPQRRGGSPHRLHITTDMDAESRTTQTLFGFGMVLGGIALFLLSLVVTRYTLVGIKRYIQMNFSLLRGY